MADLVQPAVEVQTVAKATAVPIMDALWEMFKAEALGHSSALQVQSVEVLGVRLTELLAMADIAGRRRIAIAADRMPKRPGTPPPVKPPTPPPAPPSVPPSGSGGGGFHKGAIPNVKFEEAVANVAKRYPTVVPENVRGQGARAVQEWIGGVYETEGFALAKTSQDVVVDRVRRVIKTALDKGMERDEVIKQILDAGSEHGDKWTQGYAETVWRNNASTAYHSGLREQMQNPDVQRVIAAQQFHAIGGRSGDGDTTPVCRAAHGTLAPWDHAIWGKRTPGLHHGCRSSIILVSWMDAERMGVLDANGEVVPVIPSYPAGVEAQPGFGGIG